MAVTKSLIKSPEQEAAEKLFGPLAAAAGQASASLVEDDFDRTIKDLIGQINFADLGLLSGFVHIEGLDYGRVYRLEAYQADVVDNTGPFITGDDVFKFNFENNDWTGFDLGRIGHFKAASNFYGYGVADWVGLADISKQIRGSNTFDTLGYSADVSDTVEYTLNIGDGDFTEVTFEGGHDLRLNVRSFRGGEFNGDEVNEFDSFFGNAEEAEFEFNQITEGRVTIVGDEVELNADNSQFDSLSIYGDDAYVSLRDTQVARFTMGDDGYGNIRHSFVNGHIGYGTEVDLIGSRSILKLSGDNYVYQRDGQLLVDAVNGRVDHFEFTEGARADGEFDDIDLISFGGATEWTAEELFGSGGSEELVEIDFAGIELAGTFVETYDDWYGKG